MDSRGILSLLVTSVNYGVYSFYLYELFLGTYDKAEAKGIYYLVTFFALVYFILDEIIYCGYNTFLQYNSKIAYFILLAINFLLFYFTLTGKIIAVYAKIILYIYNVLISAAVLILLITGIRHKAFRK